MVDAVSLGWALAALLFLLALWQPAAGLGRRHRHAAMAGALILAGAALYGADIMNLPEMVGALVIGAALGLLAARELPMQVLPALLAGLGGAIGVAMACLALAIRHNPYAFGLLGEDAASIAPWRVGALAVALAGGVMAAGAGAAWSTRRDGGVAGVVLAGLLALLAGGAFARFGASERWAWAAVGLALAVPAGVLIGTRARAGGAAAGLAAVVGLAGWSGCGIAFLLENTGLLVAAGLAASAGTLLALRLCVELSGKGLADGRRHA